MRSDSGSGVWNGFLELLRTPVMIGVVCVAGLGVAMNGFVDLARDHRSGEEICVDAHGDWNGVYKDCKTPVPDVP